MISVGSRANSSSARGGKGRDAIRGCGAASPAPHRSPHSPPSMSRAQRQSRQRSDSLLALAGAGLSFSPVLQSWWGVSGCTLFTPYPFTPGCPHAGDAVPVDSADGGGEILLQPQEEALHQAVDAGLLPALGEQAERAGARWGSPVPAGGTQSSGSPLQGQGDTPTLVRRGGTMTVGTLKKWL